MNTSTEAVLVKAHIWSTRERIGRIRYAAYSFGLGLIVTLVYAVLLMAAGPMGSVTLTYALALPVVLFALVMQFIFAIRRLHDIGSSGWWSLLLILPFVNLVFALVLLFAPGTAGDNRYGPKPAPNHLGLYLLAFSIPAVYVFGIVMAIAIPSVMSMGSKAAAIEGYAVGKTLADGVLAFEMEQQRLPTIPGDLPAPDISHMSHVAAVGLDPQGVIKVSLKGGAVEGKTIAFMPEGAPNDNGGWRCVSDLPPELLPAGCEPAN